MTFLKRLNYKTSETIGAVSFPFDAHSSFLQGPAEAPPLIREAFLSPSANTWSETGVDVAAHGHILDLGDVPLANTVEDFKEIEETISQILSSGLIPLSLGGDHSITYPLVKAFMNKYPDLQILHFDAHPDLYDELNGNRMSHACPFARIMEHGVVQRLVQVGIRTINGHQRAQADRFGVEVHEMRLGLSDLPLSFNGPLYISFDMDVLDPAFAPGVSHQEPGGLSIRDAIDLIHKIEGRIVGADLVEMNPRRDPSGITAMAAGKIYKEIAARLIMQHE